MNREDIIWAQTNDTYVSQKQITEMYRSEFVGAVRSGQPIPDDILKYIADMLEALETNGDNEETEWRAIKALKLKETARDRQLKKNAEIAWRDTKILLANRWGIDPKSKYTDGWDKVRVNMFLQEGSSGLTPKEIARYIDSPKGDIEKMSADHVRRILRKYKNVKI